MARIKIGNIKGPVGPTGQTGKTGPIGPIGPAGPLPPLADNFTTTQAGVAALDAAAGKRLHEGFTQLNSDMEVKNVTEHFYKNAPVTYVQAYKVGHIVQCIFAINAGATGWVEVAICDTEVAPLMDVPVFRARGTTADDNVTIVNGTLKASDRKLYLYISKALATNLTIGCIYPTAR